MIGRTWLFWQPALMFVVIIIYVYHVLCIMGKQRCFPACLTAVWTARVLRTLLLKLNCIPIKTCYRVSRTVLYKLLSDWIIFYAMKEVSGVLNFKLSSFSYFYLSNLRLISASGVSVNLVYSAGIGSMKRDTPWGGLPIIHQDKTNFTIYDRRIIRVD